MDLAGSGAPNPERVRDSAEFVAAMQELKDWSGLTYRELTSRAEAVGEVLPRSTVANMLGRTTVPREELVAAFVRACGCGPGELDAWLRVRKELTRRDRPAGTTAGTSEPERMEFGHKEIEYKELEHAGPEHMGSEHTGPNDTGPQLAQGPEAGAGPLAGEAPEPAPSRRRLRPRLLAVVAAGAVLGAVASAAALTAEGGGNEDDAPPRPVTAPAPGPVQIRVVHSGLCLAEQGGRNGQLYQQPCSKSSIPRFSLKRLGSDWRLETFHATYGWGCTGVQEKSVEIGAPVEDQECGKRGPAEAFRLEPLGTPVRGFLLRPVHSDLCAGVEDAASRKGAEIRQLACSEDGAGQLFSFDRRPSEGAGQPRASSQK
ncbi:hypothetical protein ABZ070_06775 [Streptomyces sp. NPDC006283]|uniref:helix-turn-helix domain-containing protein n=1 Tax=Streptomyces sp. NPDC006283 TaxID=3156741 RepID=UPI0033B97A3A